MNARACRKCRMIVDDNSNADAKKESVKVCPNCGSGVFTTFYKGTALIIDPEKSEVAKTMDVRIPGKFALRLSR
jgi:DNA-directed RNA polymerase subunit E"